jgi:nitrite reductase/ring-hydroxylating ferredoxin subunit
MSTSIDERIWVCTAEQLPNGNYRRLDVLYAGDLISAVVFRYKGQCLAYRNLCVHMPRQLDCEKDMIFDATGQYLRCSMHGIVYDPVTGASVSSICHGEKLTPIGIIEDQDGVWIKDRRVKSLALAW